MALRRVYEKFRREKVMYSLFLLSVVVSALDNMDSSFEDAATILGANKLRMMFTITLPMIIPSIFAGMILVFLESRRPMKIKSIFPKRLQDISSIKI